MLNRLYIQHFLLKSPSSHTHSNKKLLSPKHTISSFWKILAEDFKELEFACSFHHSPVYWKHFHASFLNCNPKINSVSSKNISMADFILSHFKLCWAKLLQPFINTNYKEHLFRALGAKQQLHLSCSSNQVRIQPWPFAKLCYAYDRSYFADSIELWIVQNGWVMSEKTGFKVSHPNMFLLFASLLACFYKNECYIMDVHRLLVRLSCLLLISGTNFLHDFGDDDEQ